MSDAPGDPIDPQPAALEAAAEAFAAARSARRLLDVAGRRGANAVNRSHPIPGARRASNKAQASLEEAARKLEDARDRWAALMRGIAADLAIEPARLVTMVEQQGLAIALEELEEALHGARDAAASQVGSDPQVLAAAESALQVLRASKRSDSGVPPS
jgi:sirohydrochlorin ferrochelatase